MLGWLQRLFDKPDTVKCFECDVDLPRSEAENVRGFWAHPEHADAVWFRTW
jgi:hypothetical protein